MNTAPDCNIEHLLAAEENKLSSLARRLFTVEAIEEELLRVTRGKPFAIQNDVVWTMALDCRDAFVIHFASWIRGMYEKGGFLRQIQAHYLRNLRRQWKAGTAIRSSDWLGKLLSGHHADSFERLFPDIKVEFPKPDDVAKVRDRFVDAFESVVDDRDSNRAHPYEGQYAKNAKMLDLKELRRQVLQAEQFLNSIRLVSCGSTFLYSDRNRVKVDEVAKELVDNVLLGTKRRRNLLLGTRSREEYYEQCHAKHDAIPGDSKPLFNAGR